MVAGRIEEKWWSSGQVLPQAPSWGGEQAVVVAMLLLLVGAAVVIGSVVWTESSA